MIIECDSCRTKFRLDDSRITPGGVRVRCTKCQSVFIVKPPPSPDDVSVEEMFGVSTDTGREPSPPASSGEDEGAGAGMAGDSASFENEGEGEGEDEAGLRMGAADEDAGKPEEEAPQSTAGFEGLDFSFAMDKSGEPDEADENEATGVAGAPGKGLEDGREPEAGFAAEDDGAAGPGTADEEDEGPSPDWGDEAPGTEGDEEGGAMGMGFDLGLDESVADALGGIEDEPVEEEDVHGGWDINMDTDEDGQDEGFAGSGDEGSAPVDDTGGLADEDTGPEAPEKETTGFDDDEGGFDEGGEDTGLTGNTLGDALEGLEDEEHAGVEEQLRELEKKVIPFNIGTQGERPAAGSEAEEETAEEDTEDEEAGDLDWPSASEPEVPGSDAWFDEPDGEPGQDFAAAAPATAPGAGGPGAAAPSRAKAGLLLILLAIIIIGGGVLYLTGAFDSTGGRTQTAEAVVEIELMKGYVVENKTFGNYFALEAMVRNKTESPQEIKGARGVLFNTSGARIAERLTTPGRVLSAEDLRTMTAAELDRYFKDPTGGTIPARGVIPVMVLFTDMPVGISEYGVDVIR